MPAFRQKTRVRSRIDKSRDHPRIDAWIEKLMHLVLGTTMTQVALCRFLIRESIIDRRRLLTFLEDRGVEWTKTSSDEALLPLVTILSRVKSVEEPDFPVSRAQSKVSPVWQSPRRRPNRQASTSRTLNASKKRSTPKKGKTADRS
jgi:hypothetical protein